MILARELEYCDYETLPNCSRRSNLLCRGELQEQIGGNYQISKRLTIDFDAIAGQTVGSPYCGLQIGFSKDFCVANLCRSGSIAPHGNRRSLTVEDQRAII
jgi:hypothetical protein